ncbi:unnamed protein product [Didymodactylos carnosus]|uniref:WD40 repeat domain-containing protein n=1 Tax=Didymodactylos carnosus TaxID=1234261 RepID=A0A814Y2S3_9BILA|nr:unnamed protein product [Didymodactylos carnosus]CAF3986936.1 unnamed protein product [Didymodactylos carnosus]
MLDALDIPLNSIIQPHEDLKPLYEFKVSDAPILSLALSPHQDFIVAGTGNSSGGKKFAGIFLRAKSEWNDAQENALLTYKIELPIPIDYSTQALAISVDGEMIIGQSDDYIWKWDRENKRVLEFDGSKFLSIDHHPRVERVRILPLKDMIIINQDLSKGILSRKYISARIFDIRTGKLIRSLKGAHGYLSDLAVDPNGTIIAGVIKDGSAIFWDAQTGELKKALNMVSGIFGNQAEQKQLITKIALSNKYIAIYGKDKQIKLLDFNFKELKSWDISSQTIAELKISPDEKYIIFRELYGPVMGIITIETDKMMRFKISEGPTHFIMSNDAKRIIIGSEKGGIKIFDIEEILKGKSKEKSVDLTITKNALIHLTSSLSSLSSRGE